MDNEPAPKRPRVFHPSGGESKTKQSDYHKTDINGILSRYIKTGILPTTGRKPIYGDFTNGMDYHTMLNRIASAEEAFMRLDPLVRKHCDNDPGKFLDLVFDPNRRGELEKLGLLDLQAPETAPPAAAPPDDPAETPPSE